MKRKGLSRPIDGLFANLGTNGTSSRTLSKTSSDQKGKGSGAVSEKKESLNKIRSLAHMA